MLISVVILLYTFLILYIYGQGLVALIERIFTKSSQIPLPFILIIGLMTVTTLASIASIFIRINWEFQAFLLLGALALALLVLRRKVSLPKVSLRQFSLLQKVGLVFCGLSMLLLLYAATLAPSNPDTGIYHAQAIHWIESYPAVPGLANLHERLGYDSSWLVATAIFSFSYLKVQSFHLLAAAFFLILAGYGYQGIHELLGKKYRLSNFLKLGFFLSIFIFQFDQISSPGTDSPTTLLIWFIVAQTIQFFEEGQAADELQGFFLILLGFYCITIKISSAPILLLALGLMLVLRYFKNSRALWTAVIGAFVVLIPFVVRNFILTGYPVFPGFPINLFHFDWAFPVSSVKAESSVIHWFATLHGVQIERFYTMSLRAQLTQWYGSLLPRYKAILLFIGAAALLNIVLCVFKKWRTLIRNNWKFVIVYLTVIAGCVFWLLSAPAFRFGFGFILAAVFLLGAPVCVFLVEKIDLLARVTPWLVLLGCIALVGLNVKPYVKIAKVPDTLVMPAAYPTWSSEPCGFGNFKLLCQAGYDSCWYSPFPCAIQGNEHVMMRGKDYRDGFRNVP